MRVALARVGAAAFVLVALAERAFAKTAIREEALTAVTLVEAALVLRPPPETNFVAGVLFALACFIVAASFKVLLVAAAGVFAATVLDESFELTVP